MEIITIYIIERYYCALLLLQRVVLFNVRQMVESTMH